MTRILIVDDQPANLYLLRALLTGHGHEVDEARHGAEALVMARQSPPDLIISDLLMPVMDGYTLLRHWTADARLKEIPFVVYTATYTDSQDEKLALDLGADAFILKPAEPEPFMARVRAVLEKARHQEPASGPPDEPVVLLQYNEVLVRKLEDKARDLESAVHELRQLNAQLEQRVRERTAELETKNQELTQTLAEVKQLRDILPICSYCRKIRDDQDYWQSVEGYISQHTNARFSHGICPGCFEKIVQPQLDELERETNNPP